MQIEATAIKSDNFPHCRKDLLPVLTARQRHLEQMQFSGHNEIIALIFPSSENDAPINCNFVETSLKVLYVDKIEVCSWH